MAEPKLKTQAERLLAPADVRVDGDRPWDLQVRDPRFYARVLRQGSLGLGEAYMDGWWEAEALDEFFFRILRARLDERPPLSPGLVWHALRARLFNLQRRGRAFRIGEHHYDRGNDLFQAMLDPRLCYTTAYWTPPRRTETLAAAQEARLELNCRKLDLRAGLRALDVGCGWGSWAKYAAERFGVEVTGVTVSRNQAELGRTLCAGLPVEIRLEDYRGVKGEFDRAISLGMFEHVGYKNYRTYMEVLHRCLRPGGLFLLHTIGRDTSGTTTDPWISKYIFPNSMLPSSRQIAGAAEGLFVLEDWHSYGADYDRTLLAWLANFEAAWPQLAPRYDERFRRMWRYYLCSSAGSFRARRIQLWEIVYSKGGVPGGYASVR